MLKEQHTHVHAAEAIALAFYFQTFFALLTLLEQDTDNAAVGVEKLDDVELRAEGQALLFQLKHSNATAPPPITLKSPALWRTIEVWVDALPALTLSETTLHLVAVAGIAEGSPLLVLTSLASDRRDLADAMTAEAQRVVNARTRAAEESKPLPYADRINGCEAFLRFSETERLNLLRRTLIRHGSPSISQVEGQVAEHLQILPAAQRPIVARRLIEWWDREIIYSLCGKRSQFIPRTELQQQISIIVGDIEHDKLLPDFETVNPPEDYQPDGTLARQIRLVEGKPSDLNRAIREEWKSREQRAKWLNEKLSMASKIDQYDLVLQEHWSDRHSQMAEDCASMGNEDKCASGLAILRWTHEEAPNIVRPIAEGWSAHYYVRGSYQVLAINRKVGWHPDFLALLGESE